MPRMGCGMGHASLPLAVVLLYFAAGNGFGAVRRGASRRPSRRRRRRPRHHRHRCHRRCRPFFSLSGVRVGVGRGDRARPSRHCEVGNELAQELKGQHHNS